MSKCYRMRPARGISLQDGGDQLTDGVGAVGEGLEAIPGEIMVDFTVSSPS